MYVLLLLSKMVPHSCYFYLLIDLPQTRTESRVVELLTDQLPNLLVQTVHVLLARPIGPNLN